MLNEKILNVRQKGYESYLEREILSRVGRIDNITDFKKKIALEKIKPRFNPSALQFETFDEFNSLSVSFMPVASPPPALPVSRKTKPILSPKTDEGEFETLVNQFGYKILQPRSGPFIQERDHMSGGPYSSIHFERPFQKKTEPSFTDNKTKEDLQNGKIPESVLEFYRLIDLEEPYIKTFQEEMKRITKRLFEANYGAKPHNFHFVLSDSDVPSGCIFPGAKPPIIVLSKGVFEQFETEDEIAALIAHELTHQNIADRIGIHKSSNPEEASSDAWAVHLLQEAGYNPNTTLSMLEKIHPGYQKIKKTALEAKNPHPSYDTRRRHVEDVLGYLESKKPLNTETTPLDPELKDSIVSLQHVSFIERYLKDANYNGLSIENKVNLLCSLWDEELSKQSYDKMFTRFNDFEQEIKKLANHVKDRPFLFDPLVSKILSVQKDPHSGAASDFGASFKEERINNLYSVISKAYGINYQSEEYGYRPVGPLSLLNTAMSCFRDAETLEDAQAHAEIINNIARQYPINHSYVFDKIRWPDFDVIHLTTLNKKITNGEAYALPWNNLKKWGETSPEIEEALARFNITSAGVKEIYPEHLLIPRPIDWNRFGYRPDRNLSFDEEGNITGHNIKRVKIERPEATRFSGRGYDAHVLLKRDKEAKELLKTVDWTELETDFWGFVARYKNQLMPQITISKGGDLFQEVFCQKGAELLEKDPGIFEPLFTEFFRGEEKKDRNSFSQDKENEQKKNTVPSMLREFKRQYRVEAQVKNYFSERNGLPAADVQFGLSPDTHYLKFISDHLKLDPLDKAKRFAQSRWRNSEGKKPEDFIAFDFRSAFGYEQPQTAEELYKTVEFLSTFTNEYSLEELVREIINKEIYAYLKLKRKEPLDLHKLSGMCQQKQDNLYRKSLDHPVLQFNCNSLVSDEEKKKHSNSYAQLLDRQIGFLFKGDITQSKPPEELVSGYLSLSMGDWSQPSFFDRNPEAKNEYQAVLRNKLSVIEDPIDKTTLLRTLLCETNLKDPDFRKWVVNEWIGSQGQILIDRISTEGRPLDQKHLSDIELVTDNIIKNAKMGQSVEMLNGLLEAIEAQEDVSFMVRDKLVEHFLKKGTKGNLAAAANDYVLERIGDEPEIRSELLEFLTSPLTKNSIATFSTAIKTANVGTRYGNDFFYIFNKKFDEKGIKIPEKTREHALYNIHRNFWALPFAARTAYLGRVLFPVGEEDNNSFSTAVSFALDKILPEGKPYMDHSRLILTTHLEQSSKPLKRLVFSALITANEKREDSTSELRPGQILSQVLGRSGAAGGKILQSIHSYLQSIPDPDEDLIQFKEDLKSSKSNFDKPFRWDMLKRFLACYIPKSDKEMPRVGEQLGSGSYGFAIKLHHPENVSTALVLSREEVETEANYQFGLFKRTAEKLSTINKIWKPLINILANAQSMSAVESNFEIAAEQIKVAEDLYNGLSVSVDGYCFDVSTASLIHHGKDFKETELAEGEHFIDLPEGTKEERRYKRAVSIANLTVEIHCLLKGGPFDYDRHAAQGRAKGLILKLFDHGSIPYDIKKRKIIIPTPEDKQLLGSLLAESYKESETSERSISEVLVDKLTKTDHYGDSQNYIECFKRGILALNDFISQAGDTHEERNQIIKAAITQSIKTGLADKNIISGIIKNLDPEDIDIKNPSKTNINIKLRDNSSSFEQSITYGLSLVFSRSVLNSIFQKGRDILGQGSKLLHLDI